ncbi:MAG: hypothetical protein NTZ05_12405 [Chloroflexi bacterium]|nr:hypothetical protein [Chloroflexota bacterium]
MSLLMGSGRALLVSAPSYPLLTALVPTPAIWCAADRITGVTPGASLTTWSDLSGNARHFTGGVAPTYQVNALNGMPAVRFNGSTQYLQSPSFAHATTATIFAVVSQASGSIGIANADTITGGRMWQLRQRSALWFDNVGGLVSPSSLPIPTVGQAAVFAGIRRTGAVCQHYLNKTPGSTLTNATTANSGASEVQIGRDFGAGGADFFSGDMAEFIYYTRALSDQELAAIWGYLTWKYRL